MLSETRRGIEVRCTRCDRQKKPTGRSGPNGIPYCDDDCSGYWASPFPGSLWPGETEAAFGYPVSRHGTNEATQADATKGGDDEPV